MDCKSSLRAPSFSSQCRFCPYFPGASPAESRKRTLHPSGRNLWNKNPIVWYRYYGTSSIVPTEKRRLEENMHPAGNSQTNRRRLIYIPIVHNFADMGALKESVKEASVKKIGRQSWNRKQHLIERLWDDIESVLKGLSVDMGKTRLYQDGLPVSGKEEAIVRELANSGSRNHRLLLGLMEKGALLMGTESPELLLEEYERVKRGLSADARPGLHSHEIDEGASLLQRRDKFLGGRINETLRDGETGIVFIGMLHSLERWLDKDIQVVYPIGRPPSGTGVTGSKRK